MIEDIGFIFLYVGTFGLSDIFVEHYKLKGILKILYYLFFLVVGLVMIFYFKEQKKEKSEQPLLQ